MFSGKTVSIVSAENGFIVGSDGRNHLCHNFDETSSIISRCLGIQSNVVNTAESVNQGLDRANKVLVERCKHLEQLLIEAKNALKTRKSRSGKKSRHAAGNLG